VAHRIHVAPAYRHALDVGEPAFCFHACIL